MINSKTSKLHTNSNSNSKEVELLNQRVTHLVLRNLYQRGVREICICPGKRNAPFISFLTSQKERFFKTFYFFEERSASFFALGRIKASKRPVAVLTTSGTAVGELLPATMEGHYSGAQLILLTADRPKNYRGTGAPQAAEQAGIFGPYVSACIDIENENDCLELNAHRLGSRPIHINVCFNEPLGDVDPTGFDLNLQSYSRTDETQKEFVDKATADSRQEIKKFFTQCQCPIIIVGLIPEEAREVVKAFLLELRAPVYFEGLSGLKDCEKLDLISIGISDRVVERAHQVGYAIDGVVRIGGIPTVRLWRDLEESLSHLPVLSVVHGATQAKGALSTTQEVSFSGLARSSQVVRGALGDLLSQTLPDPLSRSLENCAADHLVARAKFLRRDRHLLQGLIDLLREEPQSEPGCVARLANLIGRTGVSAQVYLGNSLPIREWDLAANLDGRSQYGEIWGSRGVNGIDGQVSTFLGSCLSGSENWGIFGDLTALYDLQGPWVLPQLKNTKCHLVVINNGGGKIFDRMFSQPEFQNQHKIRFKAWADLWNITYEMWTTVPDSYVSSESTVIEIIPDDDATHRFWKKYKELLNQ